jgi:glycosyltransferase involved in cell wall biosynthesis
MKILFIINLGQGYSATLPERNMFRGLQAKGVDLTVITHWQTIESLELESLGIKIVYIPIIRKFDIPAILKLRRLIKTENYEIIHITYSKAITNVIIASHGLKIKIIAFLGSLSLHWHDPFTYFSFLSRRIDKLICLSDAVQEHVLKQAPSRMKDKTIRIYKGYDPIWLNIVVPVNRKNLNVPDDSMVICCVANIRKIKGVEYLIKAVNYLPDNLPVWFILVGDKTDSGVVRKMIRKTKYSGNFITIGYSDEPLVYTSICDLYIQPSVSEGLGRSVIEAMCLGKPVIVTDKGGAKELVNEGINGYIVPVKSARALAERIIKCYENRDNLHSMGEKARDRILNDFNPKTAVDRTYNLYVDLLREKR